MRSWLVANGKRTVVWLIGLSLAALAIISLSHGGVPPVSFP